MAKKKSLEPLTLTDYVMPPQEVRTRNEPKTYTSKELVVKGDVLLVLGNTLIVPCYNQPEEAKFVTGYYKGICKGGEYFTTRFHDKPLSLYIEGKEPLKKEKGRFVVRPILNNRISVMFKRTNASDWSMTKSHFDYLPLKEGLIPVNFEWEIDKEFYKAISIEDKYNDKVITLESDSGKRIEFSMFKLPLNSFYKYFYKEELANNYSSPETIRICGSNMLNCDFRNFIENATIKFKFPACAFE